MANIAETEEWMQALWMGLAVGADPQLEVIPDPSGRVRVHGSEDPIWLDRSDVIHLRDWLDGWLKREDAESGEPK